MAGLYGQVWDEKSPFAQYEGEFARAYVNSVGQTLAGGTSEIQRNIIAQRGLGMPRGSQYAGGETGFSWLQVL